MNGCHHSTSHLCAQSLGRPTQVTARGQTSQDSNQDPMSAHQSPSFGTRGSSKEQSRKPTVRGLPFPRARVPVLTSRSQKSRGLR